MVVGVKSFPVKLQNTKSFKGNHSRKFGILSKTKMSDIPPGTIKIGDCDEEANFEKLEIGFKDFKEYPMKLPTNPCVSHKTLERIGKLGSQLDLCHLRQVDQEHYNTLNPTFLDSVDKCIRITYPPERRGPSSRGCGRAPPIQAFVKNGESNLMITPQNWDKKVFHIFRKLELTKIDIKKLIESERFLYGISTQLAPYITTLRLNTVPLKKKTHGKTWAQFLNEFTSLTNLEIDFLYRYSMWTGANAMSADQLETQLANLRLKPKIKLSVDYEHENVLAKFATRDDHNMSFELKFVLDDLEELENIVKKYGNHKNIYYKIYIYRRTVRNLSELEAFTRILLHLDGQIKKLMFTLDLEENGQDFEVGDQYDIKRCLAQMSPYVNEMSISQEIEQAWDILPPNSKWPKLTYLWINGYEHPLEILKNSQCSALKKLRLDVNQTACFFSNHQKSDQENLTEYFRTLGQLIKLGFPFDQKDGDKFAEGNELHEYLKNMLPQLKSIKYGEFYDDN